MIYCKNESCLFLAKLKTPVEFKYNRYMIPLEPNIVSSFCQLEMPQFEEVNLNIGDFAYRFSVCGKHPGKCERNDCLHNEAGLCSRSEALVEFHDTVGAWICKCRSDKFVSGHMDWSRFPSMSMIDDDYARRHNEEVSKFKSYRVGHHESKEMPTEVQKAAKQAEIGELRDIWRDKHGQVGPIDIK